MLSVPKKGNDLCPQEPRAQEPKRPSVATGPERSKWAPTKMASVPMSLSPTKMISTKMISVTK